MDTIRAATRQVPRAGSGVATNLSAAEMNEVLEAITDQRVEWDGSKRILDAEHCVGEFLYKGDRYSLREEFEVLKALVRF